MERAARVATAPIQVVSVLQSHRADDALPANPAARGIQSLVSGIIPQVFGKSDGIDKTHE